MARMETDYTKKKNVLQRKVQDAVASYKRLKDILEKQSAAK